jgi:capsular exopolysaccharide synthesis family protein
MDGLTEVLMGRMSLDEAVHSLDLGATGELAFLSTGTLPPNPAELFSSKRVPDLLRQLRERYETIIMDAPPLNLVTDGALMGAASDGVLMVVRAGVTHRDAVTYALDQLGAVRAPLLGTVLNDVHGASHSYYGSDKGYYGLQEGR